MRVLFFLSDLDGGGAQRTFVNLVNAMSQSDLEVALVVGRPGGAAQSWLRDEVVLFQLGVKRTRHAVRGLRQVVQKYQPDILVATMVDANIVATLAALGLRARTKVILRETNSHRARGDIRGLRRWLIKWAYRRADAVVSLSSGVGIELISEYRIEKKRVVTIGNPVDIHGITAKSEKFRGNTGTVKYNGVPILVAVGRLTRQKGFDLLIRAVSNVKFPFKLVILGEGPDRDILHDIAERQGMLDRLCMPGFVEDPISWLAHADLFVLSSRWEGFGHVIVEAMAAGIPVIATNCPYGPADIIENEVNGLLVPEGDIGALVDGIEELLKNKEKARKFVETGRKNLQCFDIKVIEAQYIELFRSICRH